MGKLYDSDLKHYSQYFKEAAQLLGVDVKYKYIIKRNSEIATGESTYSKFCKKPLNISVSVEQGNPMIESLKQLDWFSDIENIDNKIIVNFPIDTPNLQEGCRFIFTSNKNKGQSKEYVIIRLSNELLYPTCIKCLCQPILENESIINCDNEIEYGQRELYSDTENHTFINEPSNITLF